VLTDVAFHSFQDPYYKTPCETAGSRRQGFMHQGSFKTPSASLLPARQAVLSRCARSPGPLWGRDAVPEGPAVEATSWPPLSSFARWVGNSGLPKQVKQPDNGTGNECKALGVGGSILLVNFKQRK